MKTFRWFSVLEPETTLETHALLGRCCSALPGEEWSEDQKDAKPGRDNSAGRLLAVLVGPEWFPWVGAGWGRDAERNPR